MHTRPAVKMHTRSTVMIPVCRHDETGGRQSLPVSVHARIARPSRGPWRDPVTVYEKQRATYRVTRKKTPQNVSNCYNLTITENGTAVLKGNDIRSEQAIEMNFLGDVGKSFLQSFFKRAVKHKMCISNGICAAVKACLCSDELGIY